jgi:hypothetical protein
MKQVCAALAVTVLSLAPAARAEAPAATAFRRLDGVKMAEAEARARVAALVSALSEAGLPRTASIALSVLAADEHQAEAVRAVAREELIARAVQDPGVAQALLAKQDGQGPRLPAALALRLARGHLERSLQLAPLEEGVAFQSIQQQPSAVAAAGDGQPPAGAPASDAKPNAEKAAAEQVDRARALAGSVPAGDPLEPDAHEVAGLAALAAGDSDGAQKEFVAIASIPLRRGDQPAEARRDRALLQLARIAYAGGDDKRADQLYGRVSRGAPEWLDALFEASWAHFRRGEDERALGNLLTLHAPFFQGRFFPESFILKALVLYENCRYGDAKAALALFEQRYRPLHDGLAELLTRLQTAQSAFDFLNGGPAELTQMVPAGARDEVARLTQEPDLQATVAAAAQLGQEIDSLDRPGFQPLAQRVGPAARQLRLELLESSGRKLVTRVSGERTDLRELLGQSLRLSYEISGREKELAATNEPAAVAPPQRERPTVDEDEVLWPFEGEYWRDELGTYRYHLGQRCKGGRKVTPVQTAAQPAQKAAAQVP